jgi:hypothetical protein
MANWLQKILPPAVKSGGSALPVKTRQGQVGMPAPMAPPQQTHLPNAALIYGVAAALLIAVSLYFLFTGRWLTALLVLLPAGSFLGYALHFIKHYGNRPRM